MTSFTHADPAQPHLFYFLAKWVADRKIDNNVFTIILAFWYHPNNELNADIKCCCNQSNVKSIWGNAFQEFFYII